MRAQTLKASDGVALAAQVFEPSPEGPARGSVVVGPAFGVEQSFYAPLAQWLAQRGWRVLTFDYRGVGASLPPGARLRGFAANLDDWVRDYEAAVDHAHAARPKQPLLLLGHSLGGQLPGLLGNAHKVSGLLGVGAGSGYWRQNAARVRWLVPYFWFLLVPAATALCGYFPGRRLRLVGDLPAGVMRQWRRWCLHPRYCVGVQGEVARKRFAAARFPVQAWSISDDELMSWDSTASLLSWYENAPRQQRRLTPFDYGLERIGHLGAFRPDSGRTLWPLLHNSLLELTQPNP